MEGCLCSRSCLLETISRSPTFGGPVRNFKDIIELAVQAGWYMLQPFNNPANQCIHFRTTGPEIFNDTDGRIDYFVAGVGTGGTITGVSRFLKKEKRLKIRSIAVEPAASAVLSGGSPGRHRIQGIGAGFIPGVLDRSMVDEVAQVSDDEAVETARLLSLQEGITCGISCGAAMAVALRVAARPEAASKVIVTVLPDSGERYLSTELFPR